MSLIHAPLTAAFLFRPLPVYAFLTDHGEALTPLFLRYATAKGEYTLRMLPIDGYVDKESYSLYCATIPSEHMTGTQLCYSFLYQSEEGASYCMPLVDLKESCKNEEGERVPAVLPLEFPQKHYLAGGDLVLRFAVLEAVKCLPTVRVFTQQGEEILDCEDGGHGEFEARVPFALLSRVGAKLRFSLCVAAGAYLAVLGSEKLPLTVRLIDNAGPTLTDVFPKEGEVLKKGEAICLEAKYYDGSGVNPRTSSFCLDGHNLSQEAEWSEVCVTYTPKKPLRAGKHVMELTLRDRKGNRSYHRLVFYVGERRMGEEARTKGKGKAKPWHAAAFAAMQEVKEKYKGRLNVVCGMELGNPHQYPTEAKASLAAHPYDFVIGSLHNLTDVPDFCFLNYEHMPDELIHHLFNRALDENMALAQFDGITTLGHITYMHRYITRAGKPFDFKPYHDKIRELYRILISRDVALELNVSTLWRGLGISMPTMELLKLYRDCGGRLITVGTDAHAPENLGKAIRKGYAILQTVGFCEVVTIQNGQRVLQSIR